MIGGLIGLSGGGFPTGKARDDRDDMWKKLTETIWRLGGTLAYGGNWDPDGLTQAIIDLSLPQRLRRRSADEPRVEVFATTKPSRPDPRATVVMVRAPSATDPVQAAAHFFRMRWQSGVRCRARVLLSGKTEDYQGRMPGIIEEAVVAIALRQPIYVLGGFGGAAALLGELLGLANWVHSPVPLQPATALGLGAVAHLLQPATAPGFSAVAHLFRPTGFEELPLTTDDALSYLAGRAIGGPGWTDNGLTVEENRTLFALSGADADARKAAIELIERGLLRVFDK
jgi:hypothetical protein